MTVCGTGLGNFPQPGDPDLNGSVLSASARFKGIQVSWTYPGLLPQAVAHTLLYRSTGTTFAGATLHRVVSGNSYFDAIDTTVSITYRYWIQLVSVNGTVGNPIGPASATLSSAATQVSQVLEGLINDSLLDAALRTKIDSILNIGDGLQTEILDRTYGDGLLSDLLSTLQGELNDIDTLVVSEIAARISGDSALVSSVNLIQAQSNDTAAAILNEAIVRANADNALAATATTLEASINGVSATVSENWSVMVDVAGEINSKYTLKIDNNGYITGYGLMATTNDGETVSEFVINADVFFIASPTGPGITPSTPFAVLTTTDSNGNPAGIYIDSTFIKNADISTLKLAGNAVFVPVFAAGGGTITLTTTAQILLTLPLTLSGMGASDLAGVIANGFIGMYPTSGGFADVNLELYIYEASAPSTWYGIGGIGVPLNTAGDSVNASCAGFDTRGNGTYGVIITAKVVSGTKQIQYQINGLVMAGKR
jgi:hypothetical protein